MTRVTFLLLRVRSKTSLLHRILMSLVTQVPTSPNKNKLGRFEELNLALTRYNWTKKLVKNLKFDDKYG